MKNNNFIPPGRPINAGRIPRPGLAPEGLRQLPKGYFFGFLLALAFLPPDYRLLYFPSVGGVILSAREVCFLALPVVYYVFYPDRKIHVVGLDIRKLIFAFLGVIVLAELLKMGFYRQSVFDMAKSIRVGIPLFSGLLILVQGVKINPRWCIGLFLGIVAFSLLLTPLLVLFGIELGYRDLGHGEIDFDLARQGRWYNQNYGLAFIGVAALLLGGLWKGVDRDDRRIYYLSLSASVLAVGVAILTFNRTFLAGIIMVAVFCMIRYFRATMTLKFVLIGFLTVSPAVILYQTNEEVQRQVEKRILNIVADGESDALLESVYHENRDVLYSHYGRTLQQYWMVGLPGYSYVSESARGMNTKSDISLYNIWIKHGIGALVLFLIICVKVFLSFRRRLGQIEEDNLGSGLLRTVVVAMPFYFLTSLNIDALVGHNSGFFILFMLTFSAAWGINSGRRSARLPLRPLEPVYALGPGAGHGN